mmetsp:Transcript_22477/g.77005  ORF Transcript_22477/g.77005 Transcript_22477/m.77005 type:complete len:349 (-) Transcript_22477:75-1121(-)
MGMQTRLGLGKKDGRLWCGGLLARPPGSAGGGGDEAGAETRGVPAGQGVLGLASPKVSRGAGSAEAPLHLGGGTRTDRRLADPSGQRGRVLLQRLGEWCFASALVGAKRPAGHHRIRPSSGGWCEDAQHPGLPRPHPVVLRRGARAAGVGALLASGGLLGAGAGALLLAPGLALGIGRRFGPRRPARLRVLLDDGAPGAGGGAGDAGFRLRGGTDGDEAEFGGLAGEAGAGPGADRGTGLGGHALEGQLQPAALGGLQGHAGPLQVPPQLRRRPVPARRHGPEPHRCLQARPALRRGACAAGGGWCLRTLRRRGWALRALGRFHAQRLRLTRADASITGGCLTSPLCP